ncbi:flagellar hook-basal body complex protein FliE [Treponema sp.]|uniref:flagellar hook-basal body complex protein FliE n=2 Tax=Treponema sp. TaxID=166 RepID=UPI001DA3DC1F|nr:flagellar hook-basal body complex protein FliE [Treponema sp.]MBS7240956.1 flagellar hook-basal body complex protein FliE [Treponema sp.]MCI6442234.1 flagellar hook-basal body complex protein FliE [Spirochaetia bacterium]
MNLTIGTLELNKTHSAHMGTGAINTNVNVGGVNGEKKGVEKTGSFKSYLLEAVDKMNSQQLKVSALQEQVITDPDSVDIHDVTTAMAKAQMSLNLAQTVIERVVKGWTDLSQNR